MCKCHNISPVQLLYANKNKNNFFSEKKEKCQAWIGGGEGSTQV
jgi:hypothetical protein